MNVIALYGKMRDAKVLTVFGFGVGERKRASDALKDDLLAQVRHAGHDAQSKVQRLVPVVHCSYGMRHRCLAPSWSARTSTRATPRSEAERQLFAITRTLRSPRHRSPSLRQIM
jgi:hypothetical protein